MTIEREIWLWSFDGDGPTPWPCPKCNRARLHLVQGTLHKTETAESARAHDHPAWEPDWVDGRFTCMLQCPDCQNPSAVAGTYKVHEEYRHRDNPESEAHVVEEFTPQFFSDPPAIVNVPALVPKHIVEELEASFRLYWVSAESCANSIRSAVELLLTHFKVKRTRINSKGKRIFLSLHERIELFRRTNPRLADALMAVKWIGNAGSHSQPLERRDLLDGYELIEHVLDELFVQREKRIAKLSRQINQRRRPRSA
jgi:hypothetical protein